MKLLVFFLAVSFSLSCGTKRDEAEFVVPSQYRNWKKTVDKVLDYTVPGHGSTFRIIYANDISFKPVIEKDNQGRERVIMREGALIIKEIYKKKEDINREEPMLTIMMKNGNSRNALKNWLFIMKKPGQKPAVITGRLCIGCHESANEAHPYFDRNPGGGFRDYLFAPVAR